MRSAAMSLLVLAFAACRDAAASVERQRDIAIAEATVGDPVAALGMLRDVVARDPQDSLAYAWLADVYRRNGWSVDGYAYFGELARRQRADLPEARYYAAAFAAYTGHGDEAERWLAAARGRRSPTKSESLLIAEGLEAIGRRAAARELLAAAASTHPDDPEPRVRLAIALARDGDTAAAKRELADVVSRFPDDPHALGTAAALELSLGSLDESVRLTRRWLMRAPRSAEATWNLTRIALRQGDTAAADSLLRLTAGSGQ
ncbi:MAG TPA: tetratricopeptide repeat protein [Gemmatimonadaceae bacterium]|nr:tetratricopeptide repeat protein [Gemmatimonadaceae bacterium]